MSRKRFTPEERGSEVTSTEGSDFRIPPESRGTQGNAADRSQNVPLAGNSLLAPRMAFRSGSGCSYRQDRERELGRVSRKRSRTRSVGKILAAVTSKEGRWKPVRRSRG
jgi:hypothetical protein